MAKVFYEEEARIREEFAPLLSVRDVRRILACSAERVLELVKDGSLDAYHLNGTVLSKNAVQERTYAIRITPSSLRDFLSSIHID